MMRWMLLVSSIIGISWNEESSESTKYDDYTLVRLFPTNEMNKEAIINFEDPEYKVEIFKTSRGYNDSLDLLVPPDRLEAVEYFAKTNGILLEIKQRNYGSTIEMPDRGSRKFLPHNIIYQYNSYATIMNFIKDIAKKHPDIVKLQVMGNSYEGRQIELVKISSNRKAKNPIIFIDAGIHAREWVAPAMALYIIYKLTNDEKASKRDLNGVDWYILPVVNPDGYEYTWTSKDNRMWRKTRSRTSPECFGVDGNRNYGYKWGVTGTSSNPCHTEIYKGPKPFSEKETQIVRDIMLSSAKRIKLYISLHAYGQYLIYPWGYTGNTKLLPKSWKKWNSLAKKVSKAVTEVGGKPFQVMSAGEWYPSAGGSDDFAFGGAGIPYSYTMELTEGYEFNYPKKKLREVLPQFYAGFKKFGVEIRAKFSKSDSKSKDWTSSEMNGLHGQFKSTEY